MKSTFDTYAEDGLDLEGNGKEEEEEGIHGVAVHEAVEENNDDEEGSEQLGDMCGHPTYDYSKVCRYSDGRANNHGTCTCPGCKWDYYPTPDDCDKCLCKPAGGQGVSQIAPSGYKGCCSTPKTRDEKDLASLYAWVPPCDSKGRACMLQCVNRVKHVAYMKTMCGNLAGWRYSYGLRTQNPRCKKPKRNCNYNDHPRDHFYRAIGIARNCKPGFNTGVIGTCTNAIKKDPTDYGKCMVGGNIPEQGEQSSGAYCTRVGMMCGMLSARM